ncbi:Enoyl-CoA hydratase/carnithine racemase [Franzmannia pantelleriensis]|uniref:Enoyl-CoA hydratase/carnithine racemase n=1 Tax=Franzmannia pantelleriensis TaxID=48727 RepID=A0A1G9SG02_9GAMM|nr:enoyl-CoA hydratase-related protein [Halomonas pantelleriensis]SDM34369.1 Enoyl-CoA hydratase/carnithine racemase [Halomonas pantelleriensis]
MATRITTSRRADGITLLKISCPERRNILDEASYAQLIEALTAVEADDAVKVLIITGSENCFTAGNDLANYRALAEATEVPAITFLRRLHAFPKPVIAAAEGLALGLGSSILMHCDFAYAGNSTTFYLPFVNFALTPLGATTYMLPKLAGSKAASEMLMLGSSFSATSACELGLLTDTTPDGMALEQAYTCATRLIAKPFAALLATKALLREGDAEAIGRAFDREEQQLLERCRSPEAQAAIDGFFSRPHG